MIRFTSDKKSLTTMDFLEILQKRRACHSFIPNKKIPKNDIQDMIGHALLTPSGYNAQPWDFIVVEKKENIKKVQKIAYSQKHVLDASAIIFVVADTNIGRNAEEIIGKWVEYGYFPEEKAATYIDAMKKERAEHKKELMAIRNASLAAMTLIFAAENMGYATCPMMGFRQLEMKKFLQIPVDRKIALMIAVGYKNEKSEEKKRLPRKKIEEVIHWETFS